MMSNKQITVLTRLIAAKMIQDAIDPSFDEGHHYQPLDDAAGSQLLTPKEYRAVHGALQDLIKRLIGKNIKFNTIPEMIAYVQADRFAEDLYSDWITSNL